MLPRSGGDKVYLEYIYRRPRFLASTLIATTAVLLGFTASNCIVFAEYTLFALGAVGEDGVRGGVGTDGLRKGIAVGLLTVITVVHGCTPRTGVIVQNLLGWLKVGLVLFMVVVGLAVVIVKPAWSGIDGDGVRTLSSWNDLWKDSDWSLGVVATSLFKVFYSYAGLSNANNVLGDVKDPVRTLRSVTMSALATAGFLYTLINIAYFLIVPLDDIKNSGELIAALFFERIFGQSIGRKVLPLAVALSAAGNVMVVTYALVS
jgi:amino acid transporter